MVRVKRIRANFIRHNIFISKNEKYRKSKKLHKYILRKQKPLNNNLLLYLIIFNDN